MGTRVSKSIGLSYYIDSKILLYSIDSNVFIQQILESLSCDVCATLFYCELILNSLLQVCVCVCVYVRGHTLGKILEIYVTLGKLAEIWRSGMSGVWRLSVLIFSRCELASAAARQCKSHVYVCVRHCVFVCSCVAQVKSFPPSGLCCVKLSDSSTFKNIFTHLKVTYDSNGQIHPHFHHIRKFTHHSSRFLPP